MSQLQKTWHSQDETRRIAVDGLFPDMKSEAREARTVLEHSKGRSNATFWRKYFDRQIHGKRVNLGLRQESSSSPELVIDRLVTEFQEAEGQAEHVVLLHQQVMTMRTSDTEATPIYQKRALSVLHY